MANMRAGIVAPMAIVALLALLSPSAWADCATGPIIESQSGKLVFGCATDVQFPIGTDTLLLSALLDRISTLETRISTLETRANSLQTQINGASTPASVDAQIQPAITASNTLTDTKINAFLNNTVSPAILASKADAIFQANAQATTLATQARIDAISTIKTFYNTTITTLQANATQHQAAITDLQTALQNNVLSLNNTITASQTESIRQATTLASQARSGAFNDSKAALTPAINTLQTNASDFATFSSVARNCSARGQLSLNDGTCRLASVDYAYGSRHNPGLSCQDLLNNGVRASGLYFITDSAKRLMQVYCDQDTSGGGWTLIARVSSDFAWICPEQNGGNCTASTVDPNRGNLFGDVHERTVLDLVDGAGEETGVHLPLDTIRGVMATGYGSSLRFTFATPGWTPQSDIVTTFTHFPAELFVPNSHGQYRRDIDYTVNVLRLQTGATFVGSALCWGHNYRWNYRNYDQGLHFGTLYAADATVPCHMINDATHVQLKSHYAEDPLGRKAWHGPQRSILRANALQFPSDRIAIWARGTPRAASLLGSAALPASSCAEIYAAGERTSGAYWLSVGGRTFRAECDMVTAGGGWTLGAKITMDYEWACPDQPGTDCMGSRISPREAQLWSDVHTRSEIGLTYGSRAESGTHLPLNDLRALITGGSPQLRFVFYNAAGVVLADLAAMFNTFPIELFTSDGSHGKYTRGTDFNFNVIVAPPAGTNVGANIICWSLNYKWSYRGYDHSLHMGVDNGGFNGCHMVNDNAQVQIKSHYTNAGSDGLMQWYGGQHSYLRSNGLSMLSDRIAFFVRSTPRQPFYPGGFVTPAASCRELRGLGVTTSGVYWVSAGGILMPVQCDMATAGGGWTLVGKVTHDYSWICPDAMQAGAANCLTSGLSRYRANLWDVSHERRAVSLTRGGYEDSGTHLPVASIRAMFATSSSRNLRFTFYDTAWGVLNDGFASFNYIPDQLFTPGVLGAWLKGTDYASTIIQQQAGTSFTMMRICWALNYPNDNYRGYDHNLHMGISTATGNCHMDNNNGEVQVKSHYTSGGDGMASWYAGQHSMLRANGLQVGSDAIAFWVR